MVIASRGPNSTAFEIHVEDPLEGHLAQEDAIKSMGRRGGKVLIACLYPNSARDMDSGTAHRPNN